MVQMVKENRPMVRSVDACLDLKEREKNYYFYLLNFIFMLPSFNLMSESISTANYLFMYLNLKFNNFVSVMNLIIYVV